jgi:hypothetical protein
VAGYTEVRGRNRSQRTGVADQNHGWEEKVEPGTGILELLVLKRVTAPEQTRKEE